MPPVKNPAEQDMEDAMRAAMPEARPDAKPAADVITRAEAQAMAKEAAETAVQAVLAMAKSSNGSSDDKLERFAEQLAKSLAEVGNQGTGKVVVDPAVLNARAEARERMVRLIVAAWEAQSAPRYVLSGTVHLNDQLIPPVYTDDVTRRVKQTAITWYGVPNQAMAPAEGSAAAEAIHREFLASIGRTHGITPTLHPIDRKGNLVTPGGHYRETLDAIPKGFLDGGLEVDAGALPASGIPQTGVPNNGLEIFGRPQGFMSGRLRSVPILGSIADPAQELVA